LKILCTIQKIRKILYTLLMQIDMIPAMKPYPLRRILILVPAILACLTILSPGTQTALSLDPITYTLKFPSPETHYAEVTAIFPTGKRPSIELLMPIWTPGFYRREDYAGKVHDLVAKTTDGKILASRQSAKNRWQIQTNNQPNVTVTYRLLCQSRSVTTNWVDQDLGVINGAATFMTLAERARRPHIVKLELPTQWKRSMTALDAVPGRDVLNHYVAEDFDTLVDSPIVAGNLVVREFDVAGSRHYVVDAGAVGQWDGERTAKELEKIVRETHRFWGFLPFKRYHFLNVFRQGGGGLEHKNSTLLTANSSRSTIPSLSWLNFVSHEYFHAFNVKRLRPIELGPFDYENPANTTSLWISEGLTTYFAELVVARAGISSREEYLASLSSHIGPLQDSPGRLLQTLNDASLQVWTSGTSGVGQDTTRTVSYYVKGPVVGFLLDAHIQRITGGKRCLDDVIRLAYKRYSGARGFTADQFRQTTEDVAGADLKQWFHQALASTTELDYTEALDWYGLQFDPTGEIIPAKKWRLEVHPDATEQQRGRLKKLIGPSLQ
jgi:predicted metalloprotease with PDZ domain